MNLTRTDITILIAGLLFITFSTMVFPALGLVETGDDGDVDNVNQTDFPSFDIDDATIELVGERPQYPRSPTSGEFTFNTNRTYRIQDVIDEEPDTNDDGFADTKVFAETFCPSEYPENPVDNDCVVQVSEFEDNNQVGIDNYTLNQSDFPTNGGVAENPNATTVDSGNYTLRYEFIQLENWNTTDIEYTVTWEIIESPSSSIAAGIPFLGETVEAISGILSVVKWGVITFFWFMTWIVESVLTIISILLTAFIFLYDLASYVIDIQLQLIGAAPSAIKVFVSIINILFLTITAKLIFIFIKALPIV